MPNSLIFIDNRISNRTELLKQLPSDSRIIELNATQDGLQQIADAVSAYRNLDSIHLISHGSAGALYLGNSVLNSQTLPNYSAALNTIGNRLSASGDVLLYGCNVAEGETGAAFIAQLAQATGADVAASTDITGQGGDWDLEAQQGTIESQALELKGVEALGERDFTILSQGGGIVITDLGGSDGGGSLSVQADGKILLGGYSGSSNGSYDFAVVRYNSDGSLDTSFGGDGKLTTDLVDDNFDFGKKSLSVQADGKILLGGSIYDIDTDSSNFAFVRYNTDGSLDTSFSGDGKLTTDLGGSDGGSSLSLQADGKILLGGYTYNNGNYNFALVRYNTDGSLDTGFSGDGMLTTDFLGSDFGSSLSVQADGKILLGGTSNGNFALVRYNTDGSLDTSFSGDGMLTTDLGGSDGGSSLSLQADGKILLGGYSGNYLNYNFALVRYNTDGSLDTGFSGDGMLTTDLGGNDSGRSLSLQADGKILLGGYTYNSNDGSSNFALVRYNSDGSLDSSFSGDGKLITDLGGNDVGNSLSLQADGKILLGGDTYSNGNYNFALVRYNTDGSLDSSFSTAITGSLAITGTTTQGRTLTAKNAVIDPIGIDDSRTPHYQWLADGQVISGATGSRFTLTQAQVGKAISLQLDYTDKAGLQKSLLSAATQAVANTNDAPTGSVVISGLIQENALVGHQLTAAASLADVDGLGTFTYQWLADGVAIRGATAETFIPTVSQQEKAISVKVQYTDDFGKKETVQSAVVATAQDAQYGDLIRVGSNDRLQGGIFTSDLYGYAGNDELSGDAGEDRLYGGYGDDSLYGGIGNDELEGDQGNDKLYGELGNDVLTGGTGRDSLYGGDGNDVLDGSSDRDFMDGGNGRDTYYVDNPGDVVRDSGTDNVKDVLYITAYLQSGYSLGEGIENAILSGEANASSLTGNASSNTLTGNTSENKLSGGVGIDTLNGGDGNDTLMGGEGKDVLNGGAGRDVFKLEKLIESGLDASTRDIVQSFERGQDKLGLSALDANTSVAGDQAFSAFISSTAVFTKAGQLQLKSGVLYGNTDADADAEFSIALTGITTLTMSDIVA